MPLYAFDPIPLSPAPPATPGTAFQDLAASELAGTDSGDAIVTAGLADMASWWQPHLDDLTYIGVLFQNGWNELAGILSDSELDDLTPFVLAAVQTDSGLDSVAGDVLDGISLLPPSLLSSLLSTVFNFVDSDISNLAQQLEQQITDVQDWVQSIIALYFPIG